MTPIHPERLNRLHLLEARVAEREIETGIAHHAAAEKAGCEKRECLASEAIFEAGVLLERALGEYALQYGVNVAGFEEFGAANGHLPAGEGTWLFSLRGENGLRTPAHAEGRFVEAVEKVLSIAVDLAGFYGEVHVIKRISSGGAA